MEFAGARAGQAHKSHCPSADLSADITKAIGLFREGSIDAGTALYVQVLKASSCEEHPTLLPVGLHLRFLHDMGLHDAAATIRREALNAGQNLSVSAMLGKPPNQVAAEYRQLFAHGAVNSRMVADFLIQLSALGEIEELVSFLDVDRFVYRSDLCIDFDALSGSPFWEAVAAVLLKGQSEGTWQEAVQSVRKMHFISLNDCTDGLVQRLMTEVRHHVERFLANIRSGRGAAMTWLPGPDFVLSPWAVISTGEGYNVPHIHHLGAISGVLYIAGPDEVGLDGQPVGALRVGPDKKVQDRRGWPDFAVAPKRGSMIMMPSYFTHWTVPMGKPGLRISIAFDVADPRE